MTGLLHVIGSTIGSNARDARTLRLQVIDPTRRSFERAPVCQFGSLSKLTAGVIVSAGGSMATRTIRLEKDRTGVPGIPNGSRSLRISRSCSCAETQKSNSGLGHLARSLGDD